MSHVVIVIQQSILPPPDAQAGGDPGSMAAEISYTPPNDATASQIGDQVARIVKRLGRLADSEPPKALSG